MLVITDEMVERHAMALIVALDEEAPRIASDRHHLFKFDLGVARRVARFALEVTLNHDEDARKT